MPYSKQDKPSKDRIYSELRRSIMVGERVPGERLSVEKLAEFYGTSITPIRDVLQQLREAGLVTIKPRSGYFVAQITLKQLRDLLELNEILELASIERAAVRITRQQINELEQIHRGNSLNGHSQIRPIDQDRQFHYLIALASGNQEIANAIMRVQERLSRFLVICGVGDAQHESHQHIIEALRVHDVETAQHAVRSELKATRETVLEYVIQQEGKGWFLES